jgi:hypothetical protein
MNSVSVVTQRDHFILRRRNSSGTMNASVSHGKGLGVISDLNRFFSVADNLFLREGVTNNVTSELSQTPHPFLLGFCYLCSTGIGVECCIPRTLPFL